VINEIATLAGVDRAAANQILEKLWAQGIDLSECTQRAFKMAVMEAARSAYMAGIVHATCLD